MMDQQINHLYYAICAVLCACFWLSGCASQSSPKTVAPATVGPQPTTSPTTQPTATPTYIPTFESADCQFYYEADVEIQCGYLIVPEDRENPERTIRLHVAVVSSRSSTPAPDPVIFLAGGPGVYTLFFAHEHIETFEDILNERDLILFDQRGVGYSEPALDCPETEEARLANIEKELDYAEELAIYLAALTASYERLVGADINLSAYNSAASAADLHDLRQVLGYETWNLLGISYGTRLALTTMRDYGHTGTIRSVILDSVDPLHIDNLAEYGANTERSFNLLFARCAADDACHRAFPDLATHLYKLVDTLNNEPVTVVVTDRANDTTYHIPFNGDDLMHLLFQVMYSKQIIYIPQILGHLEQGRTTKLSYWLDRFMLHVPFSEGMNLSVDCAEEVAFSRIAEFQASTDGMPPQLARLVEQGVGDILARCKVWQVEATDPVENEPVVNNIPTLLLAGDYDPATPPSFAQETADYLSQAYYFEFEGQSHFVAKSSNCGMELVTAFLSQPDLRPDASCMERLGFGFVTK